VSFKLSQRSLDRLTGVDEQLTKCVKRAIEITNVDFGVTEGVRTLDTQRQYVAAGKSQTMQSKHLDGKAVDLVAYINGVVSWELNLYDEIADAMKQAAIENNLPLRWGAAWNVPDIRLWRGTMAAAMNYYIDERRREGRRPFIDAPHFEISDS
jgi:peptidoglycan L-alanyl-D-glutamate endopeptidase CwlK